HTSTTFDEPSDHVDEDAIASAIRRVAESKAARDAEASPAPTAADSGDPVGEAIRHAERVHDVPQQDDVDLFDAQRRRFAAASGDFVDARVPHVDAIALPNERAGGIEEFVQELADCLNELSERVTRLERARSGFAGSGEEGGAAPALAR